MKTENKCHSQKSLLGISLIRNLEAGITHLLKHNEKQAEDPQQGHSGMTPLLNSGAFTLIELLVVVLIIGILAAIALPQYQKAVEKSRLTEALHNIALIEECFDWYILQHGLPAHYLDLSELNCPMEINLGNWDEDEDANFRYDVHCNNVACGAEIYRIPTYNYVLEVTNGYTEKRRSCITQLTNQGQEICESIKNQGWEYVDDEY